MTYPVIKRPELISILAADCLAAAKAKVKVTLEGSLSRRKSGSLIRVWARRPGARPVLYIKSGTYKTHLLPVMGLLHLDLVKPIQCWFTGTWPPSADAKTSRIKVIDVSWGDVEELQLLHLGDPQALIRTLLLSLKDEEPVLAKMAVNDLVDALGISLPELNVIKDSLRDPRFGTLRGAVR